MATTHRLARTGANPEEARTTNILAKLGWNYGDDNRLGLTYENYKDDRDVNLKTRWAVRYGRAWFQLLPCPFG